MSNDINVDQVLSQMRVLAAQAQGVQQPTANNAPEGVEFSALLKQSINSTNAVLKESGALKKQFEMGNQNVNLVDVMVAGEKAKVAFTAMTEVRNKLVQAYQDVMKMPV